MYKDQLQGKKYEKENIEYTMPYEIKENEIPKVLENKNVQQHEWELNKTLASFSQRSTRLSRPPK